VRTRTSNTPIKCLERDADVARTLHATCSCTTIKTCVRASHNSTAAMFVPRPGLTWALLTSSAVPDHRPQGAQRPVVVTGQGTARHGLSVRTIHVTVPASHRTQRRHVTKLRPDILTDSTHLSVRTCQHTLTSRPFKVPVNFVLTSTSRSPK
jgi:hypothetical protein